MKFEEIVQRLQERFGAAIRESKADAPDPWLLIDAAALVDVARFLRDGDGLNFDNLSILTATDFPPDRIQVVYHLWSYPHHQLLVLKVDLPRAEPKLATASEIWPAANWYEREMFDLLGVTFVGHPTLRRLMLPEDWVGHPLRKDWQEPAEYQGMPTTRTFSNDLQGEYSAELAKSRPLRALLVHDGKRTRRAGERLASRLELADIETQFVDVEHADPAHVRDCDLLLLGVYGKGLLSASAERSTLAFVERLPDLAGKPCAVFEVYTGAVGELLDQVASVLTSKHGKLLGRGAVIASKPDKDPDGLAATLVDAVRYGDIVRSPAPPPPASPTPPPAASTPPAPSTPPASSVPPATAPTSSEASHA